jgi:putative colanic acid biosynthesis acetyltransferase WcaF
MNAEEPVAVSRVDLSRFDNAWYRPGRGVLTRLAWLVVNALVLQNALNPSSALKVLALRVFGARVGRGVNIKPGVNVKYPWHIEIGDYAWIGENAWLDSLAPIHIGAHACISQGVYCCTGNHDWTDPHFGLIVKSIIIEDGAWVGARVVLLPGVTVASHAVVAAGSVLAQNTEPYTIYAGNPAVAVKRRIIRDDNTLS